MDANSPLKILVIEDNNMFINIVAELLPEHAVKGANSAADGIAKYKEFMPDITFLDIALPDGNGHELLRMLKQSNPSSYIVMMTASRLKEDILQAMQEGAQGYIIKPFSSEMLHGCITEYLDYKFGNAGQEQQIAL